MAESPVARYVRPALAVAILGLAVLSTASAVARLETQGVAAAGDAVVALYIAALVGWGLAVEGFDTERFRTALYLGLVLWGAVDVAVGTPTALSIGFLAVGALLLARMGYRRAGE